MAPRVGARPARDASAEVSAEPSGRACLRYEALHPLPKGASRALSRLQSFVTRYTATPEETHLPRHIDGAAVAVWGAVADCAIKDTTYN